MLIHFHIAKVADKSSYSQLKKPSIRTEEKSLYYSAPASLEEQTRPNLKRKLGELLADGEELGVSDPAFTIDFKYKVRFA